MSVSWAEDKALVAVTLDLEMSRNFPTWDQTEWDYHKGNLDAASKRYTTEACRLVKAAGGRLQCFVVGQVFEQDNLDWLRQIARDGHPLGNHTYDHVNILARTPDDLQFRFKRWPWLVAGRKPEQVILDQIRMTNQAICQELKVEPAGFRSPGGFVSGLKDRPDLRQQLMREGFDWVSTQYAGVPELKQGTPPSDTIFQAIVRSQRLCQPFQYGDGLVEIPMSSISDIHAFRTARWQLPDFLHALDMALDWVIRERAVFDFLAHPSCLGVVDPQHQAVKQICDRVRAAGDQAALADLGTIARRVQSRHQKKSS